MTGVPLRVAHVVCTSGATGVEAFLEALLPSFDPGEVAPVLFVPGPGPLVDRLEARGARVEPGAPVRKLDWGAERRLARRWRGAFDLVHIHGARAAFWALRAARAARIPTVVTVHELRWQTHPAGLKRELWVALENRDLFHARLVTTCSEATRTDLLARLPGLQERTRVVPASAPMLLDAVRLPSARPFTRRDTPTRLVTVGRYAWQKGYDLLFDALARLRAAGAPFVVDVVGHGPREPEMRALADRLGLRDHVVWRGRDVDMPALLAGADAFVTATRAEMFGIAVLEAMAIGLPVVATAVGSLPELVEDGVSGRLVDFAPEDTLPQRLADVLRSLPDDPGAAARLGLAAAARARTRFGPDTMARAFAALYREAAKG